MKRLSILAGLALAAACGGSTAVAVYPAITISAPQANSTVTLPSSKLVSLTYAVSNFTVKAPGTCGSISSTCGHVHILIDGPTCTPSGGYYNNFAGSTPTAVADFTNCPSAVQTGAHIVTLELHDDQHGAIKDASGVQISDKVSLTTQ